MLAAEEDIVFPQTVELNQPWSIGAPGQRRDIHLSLALQFQVNAHI